MDYYFELDEGRFLRLSSERGTAVVQGDADPFSRVGAPPLKESWVEVVADEGVYLTGEEVQAVNAAEAAYTKVWA